MCYNCDCVDMLLHINVIWSLISYLTAATSH